MSYLDPTIADGYKSPSQIARVMTEHWALENAFCPCCGSALKANSNNMPVADFYCVDCSEVFELKSKKGRFGRKVVDGAFDTMIERLSSRTNPNLFLLSYNKHDLKVMNLLMVPKFLFLPNLIEKRKPLKMNAQRAGWVGCNILINQLPDTGKIYFFKDGAKQDKIKVLNDWKKIIFLNESENLELKGWILDVMKCIDFLDKTEFSLEELYAFEPILKLKHPENSHIKDKIRQQLQFLRDKGYLEFVSRGTYRVI